MNLHHYYEKSFGVHLIGFIRDHKDYTQQEAIIKDWVPQIQVKKSTLDADIARIDRYSVMIDLTADERDLLERIGDKKRTTAVLFSESKRSKVVRCFSGASSDPNRIGTRAIQGGRVRECSFLADN